MEYNGALTPKETKRVYMAGAIANLPDKVPDYVRLELPAQRLESQGNSVECTCHASTNALESILYSKTGLSVDIDTSEQWKYQTEVYPKTSTVNGDYTKSALRALVHRSDNTEGIPAVRRDNGEEILIKVDSFSQLTVDSLEYRKYIFGGYALVVSGDVLIDPKTGKSNWAIARDTGVLRFPAGWTRVGGHAVAILRGYDFTGDDKFFIGGNSYGENYGAYGNGTFHIPEEEIHNLHEGAFVLFLDEEDLKEKAFADGVFYDVRKDHWVVPELMKALNLGIVEPKKSFYPDEPATRAETVAMIVRLYDYLQTSVSSDKEDLL